MTSPAESAVPAHTLKAYRFCLRAKPAQEKLLRRYAGMARWVWNAALGEQQARRSRSETIVARPGW